MRSLFVSTSSAFLLVSSLFLFTACINDQIEGQLSETPYFDLEGFMESEINRLDRLPIQVRKTIQLNGESETQVRDDIDFELEFNIFLESDINRPAWFGKYQVDSSRTEGLVEYRYTALDSSLRTQQLQITIQGDRVERIEVVRQTKTVLSQGQQELLYEVNRRYQIITKQSIRTTDGIQSRIEGTFLTNGR